MTWFSRKCIAMAATLMLALSPLSDSSAGILDELLEVDINDYALGLGVSYTDSVYVGGRSTSVVYPYITKFSPTDFDNGIVFQRSGGYGVRWLSDTGLEVGALARVQTLGFGANASATLEGLDDRAWTVEVAPTLGWRRWPIDVDWTMFADLLGHHSGLNQIVRFSWPLSFRNGYVVPEIAVNRYGASYVDYYYGVPAGAARSDRPTYTAASAATPSLAVAWGVKVKPHWLVTGRYGVEFLDSAITASPIVRARERSTVSLNFAYDGTLFDAPTPSTGQPLATRLTLTLAGVNAAVSIESPGDTPDTSSGDFSTDATLVNVDASVLFAQRHRVSLGWFRALHEPAVSSEEGELSVRDAQLAYGFDVIHDDQKEVTVLAGLHVSSLSLQPGSGSPERDTGSTFALPVLGVRGAARLAGKLTAYADLRWFMLDADRYSGNQVFLRAALMHRTFKHAELGIGYVFNRLSIHSDESDFSGHISSDYGGPAVVMSGAF